MMKGLRLCSAVQGAQPFMQGVVGDHDRLHGAGLDYGLAAVERHDITFGEQLGAQAEQMRRQIDAQAVAAGQASRADLSCQHCCV